MIRVFPGKTAGRTAILLGMFLLTILCYSQQNISVKVIGIIPPSESTKPYQMQVGAFKVRQNAEAVFNRLKSEGLTPAYEQYNDFTRVMIRGISAGNVTACLEKIKQLGFTEVIIKEDNEPAALPISTAALPAVTSNEIAYRTIRVGETDSLADLVEDKDVVHWSSSTPSTLAVNSDGEIAGLAIGNAFVNINEDEYISIAVVPAEDFYVVPEGQAALLPPESRTGENSTNNIMEYRTEPTFRLAYRFNNKEESRGASGRNGGIDILGRGENYEWLWTTYYQGGWFYDLNGVKHEMVDGYQKDNASGVELTVNPEFVYDQGVPYLQLRHILHNTNSHAVTGQRFGASADVMIHKNDYATLEHKPYGAYMADSGINPSLELMLVGESGEGIDPVDTLWLGTWGSGDHLNHIYDDRRNDISSVDSAIGFSYKNIDLGAGETKEFIVRFTLARAY
jgi:hypothetical protein